MTLVIISSLYMSAQAASSKPFSLGHKTAGKLEVILKGEGSHGDQVETITDILEEDKAIISFAALLSEVCENPNKFSFPSQAKSKEECDASSIQEKIISDLSQTLKADAKKKENQDAIVIQRKLNSFMNNYLSNLKNVIQAFNDWN